MTPGLDIRVHDGRKDYGTVHIERGEVVGLSVEYRTLFGLLSRRRTIYLDANGNGTVE